MAQAGAMEEIAFKDVDSDVSVTLADPRQSLVDPSAGPVTVTLPEDPYPGYCQDVREVKGLATLITLNGNGFNIDGNPTIAFAAAYGRRKVQFVAASGTAPAQYVITERIG